MENIFGDWIEKTKLHAKLIREGKSNEDALRQAWGDEESNKILADLKEIELTIENK